MKQKRPRNRSNRKQQGFVISAEIILVATIMVLGMVVGLTSVRDGIVTELADVGEAIGAISQTYLFNGVTGHHASSNGSMWVDLEDTCDTSDNTQSGTNSRCVVICDAANTPVLGENDPELPFS